MKAEDIDRLSALFDKHSGEYLRFDRIPAYARPYKHPDLCAFVYLAGKLNCHDDDIISFSRDDEYWLSFTDLHELTEEDIIYILRCGVLFDEDNERLICYC